MAKRGRPRGGRAWGLARWVSAPTYATRHSEREQGRWRADYPTPSTAAVIAVTNEGWTDWNSGPPRRAATVSLCLRQDSLRPGTVRITLVHRAFAAVSAAGHARFRGWHPSGAHRGVPGHQAERERESRERWTSLTTSLGCLTGEAVSNGCTHFDNGSRERANRHGRPKVPRRDDNQFVRRLLAAVMLALFASLNAIDGICCPDGCTHDKRIDLATAPRPFGRRHYVCASAASIRPPHRSSHPPAFSRLASDTHH